LIVDDDPEIRHMFRTALALSGYRVQEAADGLEALKLLDCDPPDLVVLDLGLPIVTGHEVRQEIAAQAYTRHIPIVVVTGSAVIPTTLDVACVLYKPVSVDQLVRTIRNCLEAKAPPLRSQDAGGLTRHPPPSGRARAMENRSGGAPRGRRSADNRRRIRIK
jgi:DNA-binding response OmpR family regulator